MSATRLLVPVLLLLSAPAWAQGLPLPSDVAPPGPSRPGLETARFLTLPPRLGEQLRRNAEQARRAGGRAAKAAGGTFLDPVFLGAILANDMARAGFERDPDKAQDALAGLDSPDFYASIGMFNMGLRAGDGAWSAAARAAEKAGLGRVAAEGTIGRISSAAVGHLRGNLVLAAAMTLPRAVRVDFGARRSAR